MGNVSFLYLHFTWVPLFSPALSKQLSHRPLCCPIFCSYQYNWCQFLLYWQKSFKIGEHELVMKNQSGDLSQSEREKIVWMNVKNLLLYEQSSAKVYLWDFTTDIKSCNTYQSLKAPWKQFFVAKYSTLIPLDTCESVSKENQLPLLQEHYHSTLRDTKNEQR